MHNSNANDGLDATSLGTLCQLLSNESDHLSQTNEWPARQLAHCAQHDVFRWFVPSQYNGLGYSPLQIANGYIRIASACLTTAFVISQRTAACKRIVASENGELKSELLPKLAEGSIFTTVGISHLTTSHRHTEKPVLTARQTGSNWVLDGFCPWVTGGRFADTLVIGASVDDQQILIAVPSGLPGISIEPGISLVALSASQTGRINFSNVVVPDRYVLQGPAEAVLKPTATGPSTGGLETSSLALGLATAAINYIDVQSNNRPNLKPNLDALQNELADLNSNLNSIAFGEEPVTKEQLRTACNSFVMRSTQSALLAAKGAGFVNSHPVGRWCREALFFLVWSCPQSVSDANLCELAGLEI